MTKVASGVGHSPSLACVRRPFIAQGSLGVSALLGFLEYDMVELSVGPKKEKHAHAVLVEATICLMLLKCVGVS